MLRGMCTVNFFADDHEAAAKWYSDLFGVSPYYDSAAYGKGPGYLEFRIGDYEHEFGILSSKFAPHKVGGPPAGAVVYWHVDDIEAALARVLAMGAKSMHRSPSRATGSSRHPWSIRSTTSSA